MKRVMYTVDDVKAMIQSGKKLLLAGDEKVLSQLPKGEWIAGTIPYFVGDDGGLFTQELICVTELPDYVEDISIRVFDAESLKRIYQEIDDHCVGFVILPASSESHLSFSLNSPSYEGFGTRPLIGWVAGVNLDDLGKVTPKVYNGSNLTVHEEGAVVLIAKLPPQKIADVNIINIFEQGDGDEIVFLDDGFTAADVEINGHKVNFADYLIEKKCDTRLPLVADYYGVSVNTSFQAIDEEKREVSFYAPVFKGMVYKHAGPIENYVEQFIAQIPKAGTDQILFSCNCILNYLHSELEGKKTGDITGPITFGEVAYQLLNQTLVYLTISD